MHHRSRLRPAPAALAAASAFLIALAAHPAAAELSALREAGPFDSLVVSRIESANLDRIVAKLSGADTVVFGDETVRITTRYARSPLMARVREYLVREIRSAGYEPELRRFLLQIEVPNLTASAMSGSRDTLWVAGSDGAVYRAETADGEAQFEKTASLAANAFELECDPLGRLWACGAYPRDSQYGGLFISTDGGATWNLRCSGTSIMRLAAAAFSDDQHGMAGGSNGTVIRTADSGRSWSPLDPAAVEYESLVGSAAAGPRHFWFVGYSGRLFETKDLGDTWTIRRLIWGSLSAVDFHGESTGVVVGSQRAFYTRDAGESWTPVSVPAELRAVEMVDSLRVVAAGDGGQIWISEDGGAVWERFGAECDVAKDALSVVAEGRDAFWLTGRDVVRRISDAGDARACEAYAFADTVWSKNIVFRREGEVDPARRVLLGAHYDSYSGPTSFECAPGADDNATGTAAVIECARVLRSERLERTVEFVLFDAEELGLIGSRVFAGALDSNAVYEGVLNLDMLGWEPAAEMTVLVSGRDTTPGDSAIARAVAEAIEACDLALEATYVEGEPLASDHMAFWEAGIPAVLLIEGSNGGLTPYYHSCADVAATINGLFHETCTKAALGAVCLLAGLMPLEEPPVSPPPFALRQNYPNPFNMGTVIRYSLPEPSPVEIAIFDAAGRLIAVLDGGPTRAGENVRHWDGRDRGGALVQSGVYFLRLRTRAGEASRKMIVVR